MENLELAIREVAKQLYQKGILLAPATQKEQLKLIESITKIENEIIDRFKK